jgi:uncharacterized protein YukJ
MMAHPPHRAQLPLGGHSPAPHSLDGIWQDGCVIVDASGGNLAGYFGKFATQSLSTDSNGSPV